MKTARAQHSDERGVVLVWLAITLVLLLGVTALGVDVAYWQVTKNREQRAADAAALAGAVAYPGDPATAAQQAQGVAADNGYSVGAITPGGAGTSCPLAGNATTAVCAGAGDQSYQYKVTVAQKVNNYFGGIFGIHSTTVSASAQAEYLGPLQMGSPSNQFGNDPDNTNWPINATNPPQTYPNFWGNINGGGTAKEQGDAYAADWCDTTNGALVTDGCTAAGNGNNVDYTPNGYYYAVDFTSAGSADLQVFDPALVNVGQFCTDRAVEREPCCSVQPSRRDDHRIPGRNQQHRRHQEAVRTRRRRHQSARPRMAVLHRRQHLPQQRGPDRQREHHLHRVEGDRARPARERDASVRADHVPRVQRRRRDRARHEQPSRLRDVLPAVGIALHGHGKQG